LKKQSRTLLYEKAKHGIKLKKTLVETSLKRAMWMLLVEMLGIRT
jgi:hypothetical protein